MAPTTSGDGSGTKESKKWGWSALKHETYYDSPTTPAVKKAKKILQMVDKPK